MLIVKEDKQRKAEEGQYFVELLNNRDAAHTEWDRLGYWCDKPHLRRIFIEMARHFSPEEITEIFESKIMGNTVLCRIDSLRDNVEKLRIDVLLSLDCRRK